MSIQNTMLRRWSVRVVLATVAMATLFTWGRQSTPSAADEKSDLQALMRKKLEASSQILEGLTVEDAALIRKGTATLLLMSRGELANILLDEDYRDSNRDFRNVVRKLDKAAEDKNFDNALLQWIDTTKSCIECHKYVRDQRPALKK